MSECVDPTVDNKSVFCTVTAIIYGRLFCDVCKKSKKQRERERLMFLIVVVVLVFVMVFAFYLCLIIIIVILFYQFNFISCEIELIDFLGNQKSLHFEHRLALKAQNIKELSICVVFFLDQNIKL